ncbi:MAG: CPBP family intramembrane metalloprotease, partial [Actinomycetales bacterium]|nr:CPBP family intramembrane metalloprotease [Actinomycetales bacterium]
MPDAAAAPTPDAAAAPTPDDAAGPTPDEVAPARPTWRTVAPAAGVSASAFLLFAAHARPLGWVVLAAALLAAWALDRALARDLLLIGVGITIVSSTSMEADVSWPRFVAIGTALALAVAVPLAIDRLVYRRRAIRFP